MNKNYVDLDVLMTNIANSLTRSINNIPYMLNDMDKRYVDLDVLMMSIADSLTLVATNIPCIQCETCIYSHDCHRAVNSHGIEHDLEFCSRWLKDGEADDQ